MRTVVARLGEVWRRGREVELLERSMAFGALFLVTLMPLLVIIAAASATRGAGLAQWITDAMGLTGQGAQAVRQLFTSSGRTLSTTTAGSVAAVTVFGVSLMAAVQGAFERIWDLARGPWHSAARQAVALAGLVGYLLAAAWSGSPGRGTALQPGLRIAVTVVGGVLVFWWLQWLLLASRVEWRLLLAGAVATVLAQVGLWFFSTWVLAPLLVANAVSYGTIGTVLVVVSWLVGVGYTIYAGALFGRVLTHPDPRTAAPEGDAGPEITVPPGRTE
ncbi:YhjD/YihY/BrkB family envelope integrity protein [Streptacidiphilus neutrinimicus]|uniref:YhjD/YihY/BrkB family envelope integrity protein n=1 Tax=Streptacidiphilus neutrinimicus TaxID=105420 RepID=UPI0006938705|nr:YhjD/YihY/BrkB family envelope integrity protein [Streptacidiphilus neutrinimicus]